MPVVLLGALLAVEVVLIALWIRLRHQRKVVERRVRAENESTIDLTDRLAAWAHLDADDLDVDAGPFAPLGRASK